MQQQQIRRLPVVDESGCLTGILSLNDLARVAAGERSKPTRVVGTDEVLVTLARIGQPRAKANVAMPPAPSQPAAESRMPSAKANKGRAASA